jgi:hypothetical protein
MRIRATIREIARKSYQEESRPQEVWIIDCALGYNAVGTSERGCPMAPHYEWVRLRHVPVHKLQIAKARHMPFLVTLCRFGE